jgi:uncharacterized protein with von Willebrand factor type A (vWA) domain
METERPESERLVTGFVRVLRANGLSVPMGMAVMFAEALALLGVDARDKVYWAGRATLVRRVEDIPAYDRAFAAFWQDRPEPIEVPLQMAPPVTLALDDGEEAAEPEEGETPGGDVLTVRYSPAEILRHQDMSALTAEEWAEAQRLISALGIAAEMQLSRRTRPSRRRSRGHPDLRGTLRRNMRTGGVPIRRAWRAPQTRPRRLVFLLDVSGSMAPYARGLARFGHAAVGSRRAGRVEVFTIGTRLTRITRELARRDPDAALASAAESVADWSGGTRLGASLAEFNDRWGVRGMARGAVVVICSDGWDRGDPALIGSEMARLSRVARRVVWVNPLKASPGYAPLARGMAAALPFVDQFVEGHAVSSLERLAEVIAGTAKPEITAGTAEKEPRP